MSLKFVNWHRLVNLKKKGGGGEGAICNLWNEAPLNRHSGSTLPAGKRNGRQRHAQYNYGRYSTDHLWYAKHMHNTVTVDTVQIICGTPDNLL